jgi:hypothetical protein
MPLAPDPARSPSPEFQRADKAPASVDESAVVGADVIYRALFDDTAFAALPALISRATGARAAMIQWRHPDGVHEALAWSHHALDHVDLYISRYAALDPWVDAAMKARRFNTVIRLEDHVPREVFERGRFYREFVAPGGDDPIHRAGVVFRTPWGEGFVGLQRGLSDPPFDGSALSPLEACVPHLGRLMQVRGELAAGRRGPKVMRDDLDDVSLAAIVTTGDGQIVRLNLAADRVLRRGDGLVIEDNRLTCLDEGSRAGLRAALEAATIARHPAATAFIVERRQGALAYIVSVTPMTGRALVVLRDPDARETSFSIRLPTGPRRVRPGPGEGAPPDRSAARVPALAVVGSPSVGRGLATWVAGLALGRGPHANGR